MTRLGLTLLTVAGCVPRGAIDEGRDRDRDGFVAWQLGGSDCDDGDGGVHPDAPELCGDAIDNDCDGEVDDVGAGALRWFPDLDGDGYGVVADVWACAAPAAHVVAAPTVDCDDGDAAAYPGAVEVWYDGHDQACDGGDDFDQDGDAYHPTALGGYDCDDTRADVNPAAEEVCGNHRDDDCSGGIDDNGVGALIWYADRDGDGWSVPPAVSSCAQPASHIVTLTDEDCDDDDPDTNPGAEEAWYDGLDQACDGGDDFDQDGDGFPAFAHGGTDCDDARASVHPDADELCGNGRDDDCSGVADDNGVGAVSWYADLDSDGYSVPPAVSACAQPPKHLLVLTTVDCNDSDGTIHPTAAEVWYDGVDQACDGGNDYDRDGDGHLVVGHGDDCNDFLATVSPSDPEVCGNHLDDNCDGQQNGCDWRGTRAITAMASASLVVDDVDRAFGGVVQFGDATGDGVNDLLIGGAGDAWLFRGPVSGTVSTSGALARFTYPAAAFGSQYAGSIGGDINGDGLADVALGDGQGSGGVALFTGPLSGTYVAAGAAAYFPPDARTASIHQGESLAFLPDSDGDGRDELVVASPRPDFTYGSRTYVRAYRGSELLAPGSAYDAFSEVFSYEFDWLGQGLLACDLDDDGDVELILGATLQSRVHIAWEPNSPGAHHVGALPTVNVEGTDFDFGRSLACGDIDGDGSTDLLMSAPSGGTLDKGAVYAARGPMESGETPEVSAGFYVSVQGGPSNYGSQLGVGDINGDGIDDVVVGTYSAATVRVFYGPTTSWRAHSGADLVITLPVGPQGLGVGDLNADGYADIVITDGGQDLAYVVSGRGR